MKKKFIRAGLFIFITTFLIVSSFFLNKNITKAKKQKKIPLDASISYIVKDFNGNIAVFTKNATSRPFKITDVYTKRLPMKDQLILKKGIEVETQNELNLLLEDLCS